MYKINILAYTYHFKSRKVGCTLMSVPTHLCELAPPDATLSPSVAAEANERDDPKGAEQRLTAGERKSDVKIKCSMYRCTNSGMQVRNMAH